MWWDGVVEGWRLFILLWWHEVVLWNDMTWGGQASFLHKFQKWWLYCHICLLTSVLLPYKFIYVSVTATGRNNLWTRQTSFTWPTGCTLCKSCLEDAAFSFNNECDMMHAALHTARKVGGMYSKKGHFPFKLNNVVLLVSLFIFPYV
jgi:hypothetical protein